MRVIVPRLMENFKKKTHFMGSGNFQTFPHIRRMGCVIERTSSHIKCLQISSFESQENVEVIWATEHLSFDMLLLSKLFKYLSIFNYA